jgi:nucleoside-diphosphate-sugar epimerase
MNIVVTGSAGYIAGLAIKKFAGDPAVGRIIGIDLLPEPEWMKSDPKILWIQADLAIEGWENKLPTNMPVDVVIHCAFKIRNPYGKKKATEKNNLDDCRHVFAFCARRNVPKLIYLSSVAAYGAKPENIGKLLTETAPLSEIENPYGYQKAVTEKDLVALINAKSATQVFVLRLNSVTGPVGQGTASKFGLITFLKRLLPFVIEADPHWARQFVHEDDLTQIIYLLTTKNIPRTGTNPEIFNIAPAQFLTARDMGRILRKKVLRIPSWSVKPLFFIAWHLSLGHIPTRPDSAMGLIYPINVNGTRIETALGFHYAHTAEDALVGKS